MMMPEKGFTECVKNLRNRNSRLEREGDYWSLEEKERLMEMFYEGIGLSEIAIRLQRTEPAVCQQIEKMDLYGRKDHPRRRRGRMKPHDCLCSICQADDRLCPHCNTYETAEEKC